ncbi:RES family NAD+ phosphorylase [Variovorax sp. J22R133]|uniref:RES family NAD+ phosphorylase n=1 Tax=Variovorax brevis TaxID=3053503 RepID=UPI0025764DCB|nr:RES family NAD+ phosphorylase [Variovorax sp. J22R133]MDM0117947.1 RES family NAD+ phosphorylase [Variovorax sp. J22R133]
MLRNTFRRRRTILKRKYDYAGQRTRAISGSVRLNGHVLPPTGLMTGRFDLADEPTTYLADSEDTSMYEAVFRRDVHSVRLQRLKQRFLATFETIRRLRVADLRGLEEEHPVLQSARYLYTQEFALDCRRRGLGGILYASAQHANHGCICLFKSGISKMDRLAVTPLVSSSQQLHRAVVRAARAFRLILRAGNLSAAHRLPPNVR